MATKKTPARFIDSMDCPPGLSPPEGPQWTYEIKLDGYQLEAVKAKGRVTVYSAGAHPRGASGVRPAGDLR